MEKEKLEIKTLDGSYVKREPKILPKYIIVNGVVERVNGDVNKLMQLVNKKYFN